MLRAELFARVGEGPHPGVVVLHESFGLNDDMRRIAGRFAEVGYSALTPDLYSHGSRLVCLTRVMVDMLRGGLAREISDIRAARDALAARPEVDSEQISVAGFCQGGGFALIAGTQPGFSAAAVSYGGVPADRSRLDGVCPVVASHGDKDRVVGRKMARARRFGIRRRRLLARGSRGRPARPEGFPVLIIWGARSDRPIKPIPHLIEIGAQEFRSARRYSLQSKNTLRVFRLKRACHGQHPHSPLRRLQSSSRSR